MKQVKQLDDEQKQELIETLGRNTLKDRDDIDFDFEADLIKMIKKLNVKRLVNNDKKYLNNFTRVVIRMYEKAYMSDVIKSGRKQSNRYTRLFGEEKK